MITEEQYAQLVADGMIKPEGLEAEKTRNQAETDRIGALATQFAYQFSNGKRRSESMVAVDGVFEAFEPLLDDFDDDLDKRLYPSSLRRLASYYVREQRRPGLRHAPLPSSRAEAHRHGSEAFGRIGMKLSGRPAVAFGASAAFLPSLRDRHQGSRVTRSTSNSVLRDPLSNSPSSSTRCSAPMVWPAGKSSSSISTMMRPVSSSKV